MPRSADRFRAGRRLGCQARICGDLVVDVPPESQVHRQVVRKRAETHPIEIDPVVRLYYVEVARARHARAVERSSPPASRLCASNGASARRHADLATLAGLQKTLRAGRWKVDRRAAQGPRHRRRHAGLRRARLRRRHRRRLDHHRRASLTDLTSGEVVASVRGDEPADPLRRRPDEPRLLRDDEPGRRQGADARGARGDGRADRRGRARGGRRARRNPGSDAGRQSDHASPRSRPRSDRARRGAVRADHRRRLTKRARANSASTSRPAPSSMRCPASPAMSAPMRPASCSPRARISRTN